MTRSNSSNHLIDDDDDSDEDQEIKAFKSSTSASSSSSSSKSSSSSSSPLSSSSSSSSSSSNIASSLYNYSLSVHGKEFENLAKNIFNENIKNSIHHFPINIRYESIVIRLPSILLYTMQFFIVLLYV